MQTENASLGQFYNELELRVHRDEAGNQILGDIEALAKGHGLNLTKDDATTLLAKMDLINGAGLEPEEANRAIVREFHTTFCQGAPVLQEHADSVAEILDRVKQTDKPEHIAERERFAEQIEHATEQAKVEREARIENLNKQHSHFSGKVLENWEHSTGWEKFGRVTAVGLGAVLLGKGCTYDRHTDQEGRKPNAATKWLDMGAGLALIMAGLFVLPNSKGPQREIARMFTGEHGR